LRKLAFIVILVSSLCAPASLRAADAPNDDFAASNLLRKAGGMYERQYFKQAADDYAAFIQQFPTHSQVPAARFALGICRYRLQEYEQAITDLTPVIRDVKFPQRDEALVVIGHCNFTLKKYPEAVAAFDDLLERHPQSKQLESASITRLKAMYLAATQTAEPRQANNRYVHAAAAAEEFCKRFRESADIPTARLLQGLAQQHGDKPDEGLQTLANLARDHRDSPVAIDALFALGQAMESQGKLDEAAERYRAMAAAAPAARQPEATYSLGAVLYRQAKYDDAAKAFAAALTADPKGPFASRAHLQLGLSYVGGRRTAEARKILIPLSQTTGEDAAAAAYGLAQCDMAERNYAAAITALDKALKQNPPATTARQIAIDRAICLAEVGRHEEAARAFADFADAHPRTPQYEEAIYRQAFSLHQLGRYEQSHDLCRQVATSQQFIPAARELDAENLFLLGRFPEATKAYAALLDAAPAGDARRSRFALRLGQCAYSQRDYARAIELLQPLAKDPKLAADPLLSRAAFIVGDALLQQEKYSEAADALKNYVAAGRDRADLPEAQYKLAFAQIRAAAADGKEPPAAAARLLAAVGAGPESSPWVARAQFELGRQAYEAKPPRMEEAAAAFKQVMAFDRGNPPADIGAASLYFLGWLDFDRKDYKAAAAIWADVLKRFEKSPLAEDALFHRGVALREAADAAAALAALAAYEKAYPQGKHAAPAKHMQATCLTALERHAEAKAILNSLAREKTVSDNVLYDLAWSQKRSNDEPGAIATYRRLIDEKPDSRLAIAAQAELAELLIRAAKAAEAIPLLEKVTSIRDADPKIRALALALLGTAYKEAGKPEKALAAFAAYAKEFPNDRYAADALLQAGETAATTRDFAQAQASYAELIRRFPEHPQAALAQLKLAEAQADAGDFEKSLATHEAFLKNRSKDALAYRAHFGVGWALQNLRKFDQARAAYAKVIAATNTETAARAQFQIGETWCDEGNFEKAVPALLAVADVYAYPTWSARALLEAGRASEHLNQLDRAKQYYGDVIVKYQTQTDEVKVARERLKAIK
jgi:TolA-binding protein